MCQVAESKSLNAFLFPASFWYFKCLFLLSKYLLSIYYVLYEEEFVPGSWHVAPNTLESSQLIDMSLLFMDHR